MSKRSRAKSRITYRSTAANNKNQRKAFKLLMESLNELQAGFESGNMEGLTVTTLNKEVPDEGR